MRETPVRIAVFCSGSASSLRYLKEHDPNYGKTYVIVGVFSDVPDASGLAYAKAAGIDTAVLDFRKWCKERGVKHTDVGKRWEYFCEVRRLIIPWETEAIVLSGFMLLLTDPLSSAFSGRMLNVHPAFLSILDAAGQRKYKGLGVVKRAMEAGDPTGSTVHIVTREADMGPIVIESDTLPYKKGDGHDAHQERMKMACDGPAYKRALEVLIKHGWPEVPWSSK